MRQRRHREFGPDLTRRAAFLFQNESHLIQAHVCIRLNPDVGDVAVCVREVVPDQIADVRPMLMTGHTFDNQLSRALLPVIRSVRVADE